MIKTPTFPTSKELFFFIRAVADKIAHKNASEDKMNDADLGRIIGFESARTSRWKHGQIAVNDSARLLALSQTLSIDISILSQVAAGYLSLNDAMDLMANEKDFVRFIGDQIMLPKNGQTLTIVGSDGSESRITRRTKDKYERPFRRSGSTRSSLRKEKDIVVVLADDNESTLEVFKNITGKGTNIIGITARTITDALLAAGQFHPRLIIIDLFLGGAEGFAAIRSLTNHNATSATEVIATSLLLTPEIIRKAKGNGASDVLERPLRTRSLGKLLRDLRVGS